MFLGVFSKVLMDVMKFLTVVSTASFSLMSVTVEMLECKKLPALAALDFSKDRFCIT